MKSFLMSTLIGGVVFVIPFIIIVALLLKAIQFMMLIATPLDAFIPIDRIGGVALANVLAIFLVIVVCFLAGLAAKSIYAKRLHQSIDSKLKLMLPGYAFIRGFAGSLDKDKADEYLIPVIAKFDDSSQLGFEVERLDNGIVVIYLPGSPNPWSGNIVYMTENRVEKLNLKFTSIAKTIQRIGIGSDDFMANIKINEF
ncbi:MAG: hypothetical protein GTN59_11305 [Candidatus Dadabacteria bacterium]|nr:hypothetical protein [Candidatus Dadabacteria bacterium]